MKHLFWISFLTLAVGCTSTPKTAGTTATASTPTAPVQLPTTIEEAVASNLRTDTNRARDRYRHPVETLNFFGLKSDMTVLEISPGTGWYLEILAPLLATHGHYIAAMAPLTTNSEASSGNAKIAAWQAAHPAVGAKITTVDFNPPVQAKLAKRGTVDMILTFRNVHNWMMKDAQREVFRGFFKALKPGGVLGIVEHRADPSQKNASKGKSGYVLEKEVIALAKSVGFKLDQKSEINANPLDTKDYPEGVWTLPPTLRLKDKDRARYVAIGESDRMTLRFVKPAKK